MVTLVLKKVLSISSVSRIELCSFFTVRCSPVNLVLTTEVDKRKRKCVNWRKKWEKWKAVSVDERLDLLCIEVKIHTALFVKLCTVMLGSVCQKETHLSNLHKGTQWTGIRCTNHNPVNKNNIPSNPDDLLCHNKSSLKLHFFS